MAHLTALLRDRRRGRERATTVALVVVAALLVASPASALTTCGSSGQPTCKEDAPPGVELRLSAAQNPFGLKALTQAPTASRSLWPRVNGHKPYGMNAVSAGRDGTTIADEAYLHQQMGASMARVGVDWAMIQYFPNAAAGGPSWHYAAYLDPIYRAYIRRGIRPLLMLARTPRRFTKNASTKANSQVMGCGTSDACWNPPLAGHLARLSTFARDVAKRYPLAAGVEVWNEPNLSNPFWGGEPIDPERYAAMLGTVHTAVKAVRPTFPVLGGATANFTTHGQDAYGYPMMAARTFIARMLRAGAAAKMDAVSIHPYIGAYPNWTEDLNLRNQVLYGAMHQSSDLVRAAYVDAGVVMNDRVVASEIGASTTDGYTLEQQRAWLTTQYAIINGDSPNLPLSDRTDGVFIHTTVDETAPAYGNVWQAGFGMVRVKDSTGAFQPKPVFCGFREAFGGFADCPASFTTPAP